MLFVGTRDEGRVYAIVDRNGDQKANEIITIARGLSMPNGIAYRDGSLYVAEVSRILRFDNIVDRLYNPPKPVVVNKTFPRERHHGWKYIAFGPDGLLYVPVGAPCNVCEKKDGRYASIMRMKPDGKDLEIFASGVRNTVGFDWHPETKELWFTDNGRDWMGDDRPPDELNRAPKKGMHFGFPYCHGDILDPSYGKHRDCSQYTPPAIKLGPHVAALGMKFYTGEQFPAEYRNQIFIAEHGSWNRTRPIGYRITLVRLDKNRAVSYETFAEGWLDGMTAWGRPVDVLVMPDGALLVSDDRAGAIYRISYKEIGIGVLEKQAPGSIFPDYQLPIPNHQLPNPSYCQEGTMNFATLKDALTFAMDKEKKANELYLLFRGKVKDEGAKALLKDLADQELGHWKMIQEALLTGAVEGIGAKAKGRDLQVSDYHGGDRAHRRQRSPGHHGLCHADGKESLRLLQRPARAVQGNGTRGPLQPACPRGDATQGNSGKRIRNTLRTVDVVGTGTRLKAKGLGQRKKFHVGPDP